MTSSVDTHRPVLLHAGLESFLNAKRGGRGISGSTESAYRGDLGHWAALLGGEPPCALCSIDPAELTTGLLQAAAADADRIAGLGPATRRRMLSALRGVTGHLVDIGEIPSDPARRLEAPRLPQRLPKSISDDHLLDLLRTITEPDKAQRRPWPQRDRALFAILAGGGLRVTEIADLQIRAWAPQRQLLTFIGKGDKERVVPLPQESADELDVYLLERKRRFGAAEQTAPLMVTSAGKAFTRKTLDYYVRGWFTRAGVPKPDGEACHAFRHTYATGLVANGTPVNEVQALLGHESLDTTSIYLKVVADSLSNAVRASPVRSILQAVPRGPAG